MLYFDKLETLERLRDFGFLDADPLGFGPSVIVAMAVLYFFKTVSFSSRYVMAASRYLLQFGKSP